MTNNKLEERKRERTVTCCSSLCVLLVLVIVDMLAMLSVPHYVINNITYVLIITSSDPHEMPA